MTSAWGLFCLEGGTPSKEGGGPSRVEGGPALRGGYALWLRPSAGAEPAGLAPRCWRSAETARLRPAAGSATAPSTTRSATRHATRHTRPTTTSQSTTTQSLSMTWGTSARATARAIAPGKRKQASICWGHQAETGDESQRDRGVEILETGGLLRAPAASSDFPPMGFFISGGMPWERFGTASRPPWRLQSS